MSSFIGHGVVAVAIYAARRQAAEVQPLRPPWLVWLIVVAWFPDLDYAVPGLHSTAHGGARISHSIAFALVLPAVTAAALALAGVRGRRWTNLALQVTAAGLSHLLLDFLVGVTPLPLFWPITDAGIVSPLGVLPSAGTPRLSNPYFLRNLVIELGVLIPLLTWMALRRRRHGDRGVPPPLTAYLHQFRMMLAPPVTSAAVR